MQKFQTLSFEEALQACLTLAKESMSVVSKPLLQSNGYILARDVYCQKSIPAFNNSAMDGYAIYVADAGKKVKIVGTVFTGEDTQIHFNEGECVKIMTGAKTPSCCEAIVPFENASLEGEEVVLPQNIRVGDNHRLEGEEIAHGDLVFAKGELINPAVIAMLSAQGIFNVEVFKKPSIAILSTGNELAEPWQAAAAHQIYNSNSSSFIGLLDSYGFEADYLGVIPDNLEESITYIEKLKHYDVVVTSGGISMGEADFIAKAFEACGLEMSFHGVNVKPGRPTMVGKMDKTLVFALPGNPLTSMINAMLFLVPTLYKLTGSKAVAYQVVKTVNKQTFKVKSKRYNIVLGDLDEGCFCVTRNNKYGSGMLSALYESNALVITAPSRASVEEGEEVLVLPLYTKPVKNICEYIIK